MVAVKNAPGLPDTVPYWLFINDGLVTELAQYPTSIDWAQPAAGWPGLFPGCCDGGTTAPPSPDDLWPEEGWPADGFYSLFAEKEADSYFELTLRKFLSCRDHLELCPDWWVGNEVIIDPHGPTLQRRLPLDEELTVVIMPIWGETPVIGDGIAFRDLLIDLNDAVDEWIVDRDNVWYPGPGLKERTSDPAFPFGLAVFPGHDEGPLGYRGPGGNRLSWVGWWLALEIREGVPVLYIHAGLVAG
jgi:hypothetical protein